MSADHEVSTLAEIEALPAGQWVKAADGRIACLFDTHMGFPQRMWGLKEDGGTKGWVSSYTALGNLPTPLHLCDIIPGVVCDHRKSNECGQCTACGEQGVGEFKPMLFSEEGMDALRVVAEHNARIDEPTE